MEETIITTVALVEVTVGEEKEETMSSNRFENTVKFGKAVFQILEGVVNILKVLR
jgi:hypothetical protein